MRKEDGEGKSPTPLVARFPVDCRKVGAGLATPNLMDKRSQADGRFLDEDFQRISLDGLPTSQGRAGAAHS